MAFIGVANAHRLSSLAIEKLHVGDLHAVGCSDDGPTAMATPMKATMVEVEC